AGGPEPDLSSSVSRRAISWGSVVNGSRSMAAPMRCPIASSPCDLFWCETLKVSGVRARFLQQLDDRLGAAYLTQPAEARADHQVLEDGVALAAACTLHCWPSRTVCSRLTDRA